MARSEAAGWRRQGRARRSLYWGSAVAVAMSLGACEKHGEGGPSSGAGGATMQGPAGTGMPPTEAAKPRFDPAMLVAFTPLPESVTAPTIDEATKLGQALYFDVRLSQGKDVSCSSCHEFSKGGADGQALSAGTQKQRGLRNTPTVFNAGGSYAQGWTARAQTIEEFVVGHLSEPSVMGLDDKHAVEVVSKIPGYAASFKQAFPDEKSAVTAETIGRALGAYTKKLFTRGRWDAYLAGDKSRLTEDELTGFAAFVDAGCTSCHQGKHLGGAQAQKLGIAKPWPGPAGSDPGRFEVTKQEVDRGQFKVPTLRNVTRTAPYLHDGSVATLEETVKLMARHQTGRELGDDRVKAIVAFLGALSGEPPKDLAGKPDLPGAPK